MVDAIANYIQREYKALIKVGPTSQRQSKRWAFWLCKYHYQGTRRQRLGRPLSIPEMYMLIPKWLQTPYGYGESPNAIFCPFHTGTPHMVTGTVILAIHLVMHWRIFFAEASHVHTERTYHFAYGRPRKNVLRSVRTWKSHLLNWKSEICGQIQEDGRCHSQLHTERV